ncbi:MAG: DMT family transporter [Inquilinus sp.]|nr:DMT family transporter [Inquilinus sp.]
MTAGRDDGAAPEGLARRLWSMPLLMFLVPPVAWSGNILLARALNDVLPPVGLAFWRWLLALAVLLPFAARGLRRHRRLLLTRWRTVLACGAFGIAGYNALAYFALQTVPAVNMTVINSAIPVLIPLFALVIAGERPSGAQIAGILVSMIGVLWIIGRGDPASLIGLEIGTGDLWVLASIVNWAIYTVILRYRPAEVDTLTFLVSCIMAGIFVLAPFWLWEVASGRTMALTPQTLGSVVYVALFASIASFLCWSRSVALIGATRTGMAIHLIPIIVGTLGFVLLGEPVRGFHLIGAGFIAAGLYVTMRGGTARP